MSRYRLTRQADQNLVDIYLFTLEEFGFTQAEKYTESMKQCIEMLAESPRMENGGHYPSGYPTSGA